MRRLALVLGGLVGLVVVAAAALWVALPGLLAPVGAPPQIQPPDGAAIVAALHAGTGGTETLQLTAAQVEGLTLGLAQGRPGVSAAWVTPGQGTLDLHLDAAAPAGVPRVGGRTVGLDVAVTPAVAPDGTLTLTVVRVRVGRVPLDRFVGSATLLQWLAARAGPPQPWWHVAGAAVVVDPKTAPPLNLGQFAVRVVPSAVGVAPSGVVLTGTAEAEVRLDGNFLSSALAGALQAQALPIVATVYLQQGRGIVSLIGPTGSVSNFALTPSVARPGVLRIAVAGPGDPVATVSGLLGPTDPPWLSTDAGGLTIDFRAVPPFEVAKGVRLRLLPESVQVDPTMMQAWLSVQPG